MEYLLPRSVPLCQGVEGAERLLLKKPLQIGLTEPSVTICHAGGFLLLDFSEEQNGGVRILTLSGCKKVRVRFGESLSEACAEPGGEQNATNDHALRDFTVELPSWSDQTFGNTGYRFIRLDFEGECTLKSVLGTNSILKKPTLYRYEGDGETERIFNVAKRTVDLCSAGKYLWDGVKRDRLVWIGDIHPMMLALTGLYGAMPQIERSLSFVKSLTPLPGWMNGYPMYSMWWIVILADYAERADRYGYAKKQLPYLHRLLNQMDACVKEDGTLAYPSYFVDWPTSGKTDELAGVRALNIIACKKAISLLNFFFEDVSVAENMLARLLKQPIVVTTQKQVAGLKYFATGLDEEDKALLVRDGARGMSTFMSYYILTAVASFDRAKAVEMMKEYYGGMLSKGATSFWEDFDLDWTENSNALDRLLEPGQKDIHGDFGAYCYKGFRHSLCHGWSSGVIAFIKEQC